MPGRSFSSDSYRYGFNGKENDNEVKGTANQQDYGMRIYDPRLGKFLSVDPLAKQYPWYTPYQFAGNTPIQAIDLDGLEPAKIIYPKRANPQLLLASDHLVRKEAENEMIATGDPNNRPLDGATGLGAASKKLTLAGKVVTAVGVVALVVPGCEELGPEIIEIGNGMNTASTVTTVADDVSSGNGKALVVDAAAYTVGKVGTEGVKKVVENKVQQEAAQWLKDEAIDKTADVVKDIVKGEKKGTENAKKENTNASAVPLIPKPEMNTTQPADHTAVSKPLIPNQ